jgi:hypothetical protein
MAITMPAVRIDMLEGRTDDELKLMLGTNQDCVVEALGVPERDSSSAVPARMSRR